MAVTFNNSCFMTTSHDFKQGRMQANTPEIKIDRDVVWDFSQKMHDKGFKIDTCEKVDAAKLSQYFKAINGILPQGCKFEPDLDPKHQYTLFNKGDLIQVTDDTDAKQVMGICQHSVSENI